MNTPEPHPRSNPRAPTALRLLSLLAVGVVFVLYRPGAEPSLLNSGVLPLLGLLAVWYLTHSLAVVAIGVLFLAGAHTEFGSAELLPGRLYPALAAAAAVVLILILSARFRRAMGTRRRMRAAEREGGNAP